MKFYILNNEPVNFYNTNGDLTGQISVSASGDMTIRPTSGSGAGLILGNPNTVSDIEFGSVAAPVSLTMLGGGTLSSNGNTLTIGNVATGDRVSINNATYSQSLAVTGSLSVTGSTAFNGSLTVNGLTILSTSSLGATQITSSLGVTGSISILSGSITMPNRPAFRVTGAGGGKVAVTALSGSYLNVDYQQGDGWNNSTGTFTAPIAGLYQVNVVVRTNSNALGTISQLIVYKNNTGGTSGTVQIMIEFGSNTTMNHAGGSTICKLAVGDTLKMVVTVGELSFDANDNFSVAYIG